MGRSDGLGSSRVTMRGPLKVGRRVKLAAAANLLTSAVTGVTWYFARSDEVLPRGLSWIPTVHGISAALAVFSFGYFYGVHVTKALHQPRRRRTGLALLWLVIAAIASGFSLYYLGDETWRAVMITVHASLAALTCLAAGMHTRARKHVRGITLEH